MLTQMSAERRHPFSQDVEDSFIFTFDGSPSPYRVNKIDGLGQPKISYGSLDLPSESGGVFLGSKVDNRYITLTLEFDPDHSVGSTVSQLRNDLKRVFTPGQTVYMTFTDSVIGNLDLVGVVETNNPVIFSSLVENEIRIMCPDPYYDLQGTDQSFTFPSGETFVDHDFLTQVNTEFVLQVTFLSNSTNYAFQSLSSFYVWQINYEFLTGDVLTISTVPEYYWTTEKVRTVKLLRSSTTTNLQANFTGRLSLGVLHKGVNSFIVPNNTQTHVINSRIKYGSL